MQSTLLAVGTWITKFGNEELERTPSLGAVGKTPASALGLLSTSKLSLPPAVVSGRRVMVPLRAVLSAKFWNEEVESTRSLEAVVQTLPSQPPPLGLLRSSKLSRSQQLLLLQQYMRLPCTPSYVHDSGLVLDRVLASAGTSNWWATVTGRFRAQRLWRQQSAASPQAFFKGLLDGSLYALSSRAHFKLGNDLTITAISELDSLGRLFNVSEADSLHCAPCRGRLSIRKKLQRHDVVGEGAWHQQFVDKDSFYWEIPQALSLDVTSVGSKSGLRYRLGVQHSVGTPQPTCSSDVVGPVAAAAKPGTRAQVAASYEKVFHVWRDQETSSVGRRRRKPYNLLSAQPHISFSAIAGCLGGAQMTQASEAPGHKVSCLAADVFGSLGFSAQWGLFRRPLLDHTKVGARIDIGAASVVAASKLPSSSSMEGSVRAHGNDDGSSPTLAITLHQQVVGPVCARVDSRFTIDPARPDVGLRMQDVTYGLDCSLEPTGAAKVVMWYSPSRREGMAEIRLLER